MESACIGSGNFCIISIYRNFLNTVHNGFSVRIYHRQIRKRIFPFPVHRENCLSVTRLQSYRNAARAQSVTVAIIQPCFGNRNLSLPPIISIFDIILIVCDFYNRVVVIHNTFFVDTVDDLFSCVIIYMQIFEFPGPVRSFCSCCQMNIRISGDQVNDNFLRTVSSRVIIPIPGLGTGNRLTIPFIGDRCSADSCEIILNCFFYGPDNRCSVDKTRQHINSHLPGVLSALCHFRSDFRMERGMEFPDCTIIPFFNKCTCLISDITCVQFQSIHQNTRFRTIICRVTFPVLGERQGSVLQRVYNIECIVRTAIDLCSIMRYRFLNRPNHRLMGIKRIQRQVIICYAP